MDRSPKAASVVTVAFAVLTLLVGFWGLGRQREVEDLRRQLAEVQGEPGRMDRSMEGMVPEEELAARQEEVRRLQDTTKRLQARLRQAASAGRTRESVTAAPSPGDGQRATLDTAAAEQTTKEDAGPKNPFANMFSGPEGRKMAEFSAKSAVAMQYGDFFQEVELPADVEQKVRTLLTANMVAQIMRGMEVARGEADAEEVQEATKQSAEELRVDLAEVLTEEELAAWDEYEKTKNTRIMEKRFDLQLGMYASGLTPENRKLATAALVEEMLASTETVTQTPDLAKQGPAAALEAQLAGLERAREKLAAQLDETQLGHFDRYVEFHKNAMKMAQQWMGDMSGGKEE